MKEFKNIKNIIFDCDGVLYKDLDAVFGQVSKRMGEYISKKLNVDLKEAKDLQTNYFHKYDTSLNGLMFHHNIPPKEFLDYVHDIDLSFLNKDKTLRSELESTKLRKFVFTKLKSKNIITNVHYIPIHMQPYYRKLNFKIGNFPVCEDRHFRN